MMKIWLALMFLSAVLIGIHYQMMATSLEIKISTPIKSSEIKKLAEAPFFQELLSTQKEALENDKASGQSILKNQRSILRIKNP